MCRKRTVCRDAARWSACKRATKGDHVVVDRAASTALAWHSLRLVPASAATTTGVDMYASIAPYAPQYLEYCLNFVFQATGEQVAGVQSGAKVLNDSCEILARRRCKNFGAERSRTVRC